MLLGFLCGMLICGFVVLLIYVTWADGVRGIPFVGRHLYATKLVVQAAANKSEVDQVQSWVWKALSFSSSLAVSYVYPGAMGGFGTMSGLVAPTAMAALAS